MEEIINKTQFPDSMEMDFGGTGKRGKVYFNASKPKEAEDRISSFKELARLSLNVCEEVKEGK